MKISLNSIRRLNKRYGCADDVAPEGAEALAERIGAQLGAIEETIDIGAKYKGIVIAKVVSCEQHPNADRLHVCFIDDGGKVADADRNENGHVQIVCGAPNVREGLTVAWLPPGATVPESVGKEPFVLEARELRGIVSNGMLASPKELALGDNHDGILEIDVDVTPGTDFAEHFGLAGDVVFDIENKMFTHRPDCFGLLGVSRELAGIQQMPFTSPAIYKAPKTADGSNDELPAGELQLELQNELPELVPRFVAQVFENIKVGPSTVWMQVELVKAGLRPINNIVDITNYFMYLTGQPLHAYDYDKLAAIDGSQTATITVRHPRPGEKIALLNGKEIEPRAEAIMIASGSKLIGVGGVMGGAETEVDSTTTRIILECANFDMYSIRRTSMAHGLFTDAVSRFNKGQSPLQNDRVVAMVRDELIHQMAALPGKTVHDITSPALEPLLKLDAVHAPVTLNSDFINERLGLKLVSDEIRTLLTNVEFEVQTDGEQLTVKAPFWRTDIEISEDIVEEVGRLYGFDRLPLELPQRSISPTKKNEMLELKQRVRDVLSQAGANEVLNYSFVHGKLLERAGQSPDDAFRLSNALSPDLHYYRLSLTPSLLDKVHPNVKSGYDEFALFEIGKGHVVGQDGDDGLPREFDRLALVYAASHRMTGKQSGAAYYDAKNYLIQLLTALGVRADITFEPLSTDEQDTATAYYAPGRAATVKAGGKVLGRIGEYDAKVVRNLKLPARCAGFEIGLEPLGEIASFEPQYIPLSRFPKVEQDICLRVPAETTYAAVYDFVASELHENKPEHTVISLSPVDIYQRPEDPDHKQITLRLSVANYDKTLRDSEVAAMLDAVAAEAKDRLRAERI